jgi:NADH dehydrogenase
MNSHLITHHYVIFSDKNGKLELHEFLSICETMRSRFPLTDQHLTNLEKMFKKYDTDNSGSLEMSEMKIMLQDIDKKLTNLPAVSP